jgi:hypothetical protein
LGEGLVAFIGATNRGEGGRREGATTRKEKRVMRADDETGIDKAPLQ